MKCIILAGGKGTRLGEETKNIPKPLVKIGGKPIIWHIIKIYLENNISNFIILTGYKGNLIKKYFLENKIKNCKITIHNSGLGTMTGGRILKAKNLIKNETFLMTYGDGLANVNIKKLIEEHKINKSLGTLTIVRPPARWGSVTLKKNEVIKFEEKNQTNEGWINGGFFVFEPEIFKFIKKGNKTILERDVLPLLTKKRSLSAYKHFGFWQCMDTFRDKVLLNKMWKTKPQWKIW